eukprot:TRINITY_DN10579_c0_g1_i1.p1 TRINITY_DN10579_c0_g1~~TRINITY_DN10579_c0_g1_i1.p1  ORF type:complete len:451 (+),score=78.17 TRINITY_DN10579_c0_g1_i1:84-1355(+)
MRASCAAWQQVPVCGGHVPPAAVWQRLRRLQGQLRRAQRRALDAKAALRREVSRRRRAEAAREEERRGRAQLRRQLRALQLAATAEAWTTQVTAQRASPHQLCESGMISSCASTTNHSGSPARSLRPQWDCNLVRSPMPVPHSRVYLAESSARLTDCGLCEEQPPATSLDADRAETCVHAPVLQLQEDECEQRSGLICSEAERRQLQQAHCCLAAERAARAEIVGHESDALALLTAATDAPSGIASKAGEVVRPPTAAAEVLFVDHICSSLAAFVPRHWAPVCSKAARFVHGVLSIYSAAWKQVLWRMGYNQSMGRLNVEDNDIFGPGLGLFAWCAWHIRNLKVTVKALDPPLTSFYQNWELHMDFQLHMYEEMRLRHRELFLDAVTIRENLFEVQNTLEQVLGTFDQRTASSDEETDLPDLP